MAAPPQHPAVRDAGHSPQGLLARLELPEAADEVLAMVRYLTAPGGPLRQMAVIGLPSPWHDRVLLKARERVEVLDEFLRARVAFFVAGSQQGYGSFEVELRLAGAALDACRAVAAVVESLLVGRLPLEQDYERMSTAALDIYPALAAMEGEPN